MISSDNELSQLDMLPSFGESGQTLSATERKALARRRGLCESCGLVKVTEPSTNLFRRKSKIISNDEVWEGICIRCNRDRVPEAVAREWDRRNSARQQSLRRMMVAHSTSHVPPGVASTGGAHRRMAPKRIQSERVGHPSMMIMMSSSSSQLSSSSSRQPIGRASSSVSLRHLVRDSDTIATSLGQFGLEKAVTSRHVTPATLINQKTPETSRRKLLSSSSLSGGVSSSSSSLTLFGNSINVKSIDRSMAVLSSFQHHSISSVQEALQILRHHLVHGLWTNGDPLVCIPILEEILTPGACIRSIQLMAGHILWMLTATHRRVVDASGFAPPNETTLDALVGPFCSCVDIPDATISFILQSINGDTLEWGSRCLLRHISHLEDFTTETSYGFVSAVTEQPDCRSSALFWAGQFLLEALEHFDPPSTLGDSAFLAFLLDVLESNVSTDVSSFDLLVTIMELLTVVLESVEIARLQFDLIRCQFIAMKAINELSNQDDRVTWTAGRLLTVLLTLSKSFDVGNHPKASDLAATLIVSMDQLSADPSYLVVVGYAFWELTCRPDALGINDVRKPLSLLSTITEQHRGKNEHRDLSLALCAIVSNVCILPETCADDIPVFQLGDAVTHHPSDPIVCEHAFRSMSRALCSFPVLSNDILRNLERPNIVVAFSVTPPSSDADVAAMINSVLGAQISPLPNPMVNLLLQLIRRMGARLQYLRDEVKLRDLYSLTSSLAIGGGLTDNAQAGLIVRKLYNIVNDHQAAPCLRAECCDVLADLLIWSDASISVSNILPGLQYLTELRNTSVDLKITLLLCTVVTATKQSPQPSSSIFILLVRILHKHNLVDAVYEKEIFKLASGALVALSAHSSFQVDTCDIGSIAESAYKVLECDRDDSATIVNFLATLLVFCDYALDAIFESGTIVMVNDVMNDLPDYQTIQEVGCAILAKVTAVESMDMFLIILQTDGLKALVNAIADHGKVQAVRCSAVEALRRLSSMAALVPELRTLGVLNILVPLMKEYDEDVCIDGLQILSHMAASGETCHSVCDVEAVHVCFDLLRFHSGSAELSYHCLAYIRYVNVEQLSTQNRNAWATLLFETLNTFLGVGPIVSNALEILSHLYEGIGCELLPDMNFRCVRNVIMAEIENEHVVEAGLTIFKNLTIADAQIFTVLILVLYTFYDNERLSAIALDLLHGNVASCNDWTGYEVDAVVGALTTFPQNFLIQRGATGVLLHLSQNFRLLLRERSEQLIPLLTMVEETCDGDTTTAMVQNVLTNLRTG